MEAGIVAWIALALAALCLLGIVALAITIGFCLTKGKKEDTRKYRDFLLSTSKPTYYIVMVIVLIITIVGVIYFLTNGFGMASGDSDSKIIPFMGILLGLLTILVAIAAIMINRFVEQGEKIQERIKEAERMVETSQRTVGLASEMALSNLPEFIETQHIPLRTMQVLQDIDNLTEREETIQEALDKIKNGNRLRIARALFRHGNRKYDECIHLLHEMLDNPDRGKQGIIGAKIRLAVAYRERGQREEQYKNANRYFTKAEQYFTEAEDAHISTTRRFYCLTGRGLCYMFKARRNTDLIDSQNEFVLAAENLASAQEYILIGTGPWNQSYFLKYYLMRLLNSSLSHLDPSRDNVFQRIHNPIYQMLEANELLIPIVERNADHLPLDRYTKDANESWRDVLIRLKDDYIKDIMLAYTDENEGKGNRIQLSHLKIRLNLEDPATLADYYQALLLCCMLMPSYYTRKEFETGEFLISYLCNIASRYSILAEESGDKSIYSEFRLREVKPCDFRSELDEVRRHFTEYQNGCSRTNPWKTRKEARRDWRSWVREMIL